MVEKEIIKRKLTYLEEYYRDLVEIKTKLTWNQFSQDKIIRRYVERTLHLLIESCLDIVNHVISYEGYREPKNNQDSFQVLVEKNILDSKTGEQLKRMGQFRNVIVHDYTRVQPEIVYAVLQKNLTDIL